MLGSRVRLEVRALSTRPDDARESADGARAAREGAHLSEGALASPTPDAARASVDGSREAGTGSTVGAWCVGTGRVHVTCRDQKFQ